MNQQNAMTDIHDIKSVLPVDTTAPWLLWMAIIAVILVLAALVWWLWHRRKSTGAPDEQTVAPSPETEAYSGLDALAAEAGIQIKPFYFRLSAILRRYMERRFHFPAAEMTTEELLPRIDELALDSDLAQSLRSFCHAADPVKFAGNRVPSERLPQDLAFVRNFVQRTTRAVADAASPDIAGTGQTRLPQKRIPFEKHTARGMKRGTESMEIQ